MMEKLKDRYTIMTIAFILIISIILYQLVNLQIVNGEYYDQQSQRKLINNRKITAPRGKITDRNGVPIAVNRMGFTVQIVKTKMDTAKFNEMLLNLIGVFEKNNVSYYRSLAKYLTVNPIAFGPAISKSQSGIRNWIKQIVLASEDADTLKTAGDVFNYLRYKRFQIDKNYSDEEAYKIMTLKYELSTRGFSTLNPVTVASDVDEATVAELEERHMDFPGVTTDTEPVRSYIDAPSIANVLGYVGIISPEEYKNLKDAGYDLNDIVGKDGIEKEAETYLKGKDGQKTIEVDTGGRQTEEINRNPAIPGNDVELSIDMKLQKIAFESLKRNIEAIRNKEGNTNVKNNMGDANAGAVVAIDVSNGEVLAMASYPSYDPSLFLAPADDKEAQKAISALYAEDSGSPTFNRAIAGRYAPGSTFKPIVGIAGLEEGIITPDFKINDTGTVVYDGMKFTCMEYRNGQGAHGPINLSRALATSCNIYFHEVGVMMGIDRIDKWAKYFGLGELTGIDLPGEYKGILAGRETKKALGYKYDWGKADTAQAAIGQIFNSFTPIELANYMSTLANGGKRFKPHLIKSVKKYDGSVVAETKPEYEQIPIKKETIDAIKEGMIEVTNSENGTAFSVFKDFPFQVAGKTGTAETGIENHSNNGVFVCYAPANAPKIAVAVVIERGVFGYFAAPVAKDIMTEYFKLNNNSAVSDIAAPDEITFTH